jgi:hypothetical protein
MKKIIRAFYMLGFVLCLGLTSNAQPGSDPDGFDDEPIDTPIDGGIGILVAVGIAYGFKMIKQQKLNYNKKTKNEN